MSLFARVVGAVLLGLAAQTVSGTTRATGAAALAIELSFVGALAVWIALELFLGGPTRRHMPLDRTWPRDAAIGLVVLVGAIVALSAFQPVSGYEQWYLDALAAVVPLGAPAIAALWARRRRSRFVLWEVWSAVVPFEDIDDDKERPVVVIGAAPGASRSRRAPLLCLKVTSQNKDGRQGYRGISTRNWEMNKTGRGWLQVDRMLVLDPVEARFRGADAAPSRLARGRVEPEDRAKIERALEQSGLAERIRLATAGEIAPEEVSPLSAR
ncbi:hypothetical protein ACEK07_40685 [Alcanivoracaceae bacterium MT1]